MSVNIVPMKTSTDLYRQDGGAVWTATGHERPVFFDESGKRRRWVLAGGVFAGGASAFWFTALIAGAIGFSTLPSMRARVPLARVPPIVQRVEAHEVALVRRQHDAAPSVRPPSSFVRESGSVVNRSPIAGG